MQCSLSYTKSPAGRTIKELMNRANAGAAELHISIINMIEIRYRVARKGQATPQVTTALQALPVAVASADSYADDVVDLKAANPVSIADCFAAALAIDLDCPVVTGDPEFKKLEGKVTVEWLP